MNINLHIAIYWFACPKYFTDLSVEKKISIYPVDVSFPT